MKLVNVLIISLNCESVDLTKLDKYMENCWMIMLFEKNKGIWE